ncbi:MAG: transglutaminase domain-containing protein [Spirochaetia bacterium]
MKRLIPLFIFVFLLGLLFTVIAVSNRKPIVTGINPQVAFPGEILEIQGENFGSDRNYSHVSISGVNPTASHYREWTDTAIRVVIPSEVNSGLIYVHTKSGRSDGLFFTNEASLPVNPDSGESGDISSEPVIISISPSGAAIGARMRITGKNFGRFPEDCKIYFPLFSDDEGAELLVDHRDFMSWSEQEVVLHVPPGADGGILYLEVDGARSNPFPVDVDKSAGGMFYTDNAKHSVITDVEITNIDLLEGDKSGRMLPFKPVEHEFNFAAVLETNKRFPITYPDPSNIFYYWLPLPQNIPSQGNITSEISEQEPYLNGRGAVLYRVDNLSPNNTYKISRTHNVERYTTQIRMNMDLIPRNYSDEDPNYYKYIKPDRFIPSDRKEIINAVWQAITYKTPYYRSTQIHQYLLNRLEFDPEAGMRNALDTLSQNAGGSFGYASLFCSLQRSIGIPSRIVGGILLEPGGSWVPHFWSEFYLTGIGWLPVDLALSDGAYGIEPPEEFYYFGNLDNRRIAFSQGILDTEIMGPGGSILLFPDTAFSLQSLYAEYSGDLLSYDLQFTFRNNN